MLGEVDLLQQTVDHYPEQCQGKVKFVVGEEFLSFQSFQVKLQNYKDENFCELYTMDSKTTTNADKTLSIPFNDAKKYYSLKYACVHGGKKFKQRNSYELPSANINSHETLFT